VTRATSLGLLALLLAPGPASGAGRKGDLLLLAWTPRGDLALVQETVNTDTGTSVGFRVVGPGVLQKRYEISNEVVRPDGKAVQTISAEACHAQLLALRDLLRDKAFKGITLSGEACAKSRGATVSVAPEQAGAAETSELPPSAAGDALIKGDWRVTLKATSLVIQGARGSKTLRLPRSIAPEAAHVLVSPSRRLLLILQSVEGGDQILAAGFGSKTGELADLE
jgi:hypothetical protein